MIKKILGRSCGKYIYIEHMDLFPTETQIKEFDAFKESKLQLQTLAQEMVNRAILQIFSDLDQPESLQGYHVLEVTLMR